MSSLCIVKPLPASLSTANDNNARILTPDPKEAALYGSGLFKVALDFGQSVAIDSVLIGYHSATAGQVFSFAVLDGPNGNPTSYLFDSLPLAPLGFGPPSHAFRRAAAPMNGRYWAVYFADQGTPNYTIGVFAAGLAFQPQYGHEYGGGRAVIDTGSASRLFGGGFGVDFGTTAASWSWTMGDIQPAELRSLFQLVREVGATRSVVVVEDPDQTAGLNERIHWGLFQRLEAYERLDPLNTRWSFQIEDWA